MTWSLPKLLLALDADVATQLAQARELLGHPVDKGDASETLWLALLQKYLPQRYEARRAFIVDSKGQFSDQIDIVIHDRQYSPFVFSYGGSDVVPAESVYAVFEVKQELSLDVIEYAHDKLASVRCLHRTSLPIPSAAGLQKPKVLHHILGGVLSVASGWSPPLGESMIKALGGASHEEVIDLMCVAGIGTVERLPEGVLDIDLKSGAGARFLLLLIARLQEIGTAPMLDVRAYAAWLK